MMRAMKPWLAAIPAWVLAAVYAYAAAGKLGDPGALVEAIGYYQLLPAVGHNALALCLPWWELGAAAALIWPSWRRAGALAALGLAGMFTVAVGSALARGLDISCGCFGAGGGALGWRTLGLDLLLLGLAAAVYLAPEPEQKGI